MNNRWILVVVGLLALIGFVLWIGPKDIREFYDWDVNSTQPEGAKALVELLDHFDMPLTMTRKLPDQPEAPVLLLSEYIDSDQEDALLAYVEAGGTVVQATDDQLLRLEHVDIRTTRHYPTEVPKTCDWPELADVETVYLREATFGEATLLSDADFCFGQDGSWLLREHIGKGTIYTLSGGEAFLNRSISHNDNAILLIRLLETDGRQYHKVIRYNPDGFDIPIPPSLSDYIQFLPWAIITQLLLAFGMLVYWRIIRPNRVIEERVMTQLPGSTTVQAFGYYLWSSKQLDAIATMARTDLHERLRARVGALESDSTLLIDMVVRATHWPKKDVEYVLFGPNPTTRTELYELTLKIADIDAAFSAQLHGAQPND
ncbi:DUF4350 domain-containing protein [Stomatohabitans albus]|uniref:DUF4350 domain-containing protein n=1 Tax=Stomatohabitans albus TaxID=3110766 RepID=UPI00300D41EC